MKHHYRTLIFICTLMTFSLLSPASNAAMNVPELRQQAFEFISQQLKNSPRQHRLEIEVAQLDSRLRLSDCSQDLHFQLHGQKTEQGRILVKASCQGEKPWSIFVPAFVKRFVPVATTKHPLRRGQKVRASDIVLQEYDVSKLRDKYFTSIEQVTGQVTKRTLSAETPLQTNQLEAANLVNRGDEVYISANQGPISVQMPATALSNGKYGQQINVKNRSSSKVVRVRVTGQGQVEAIM